MSNAFSQKAADLRQKEQQWETLTTARKWIVENYESTELEIRLHHFKASGVYNHAAAMSCIIEFMVPQKPSVDDMLAWIDSQLKELTK